MRKHLSARAVWRRIVPPDWEVVLRDDAGFQIRALPQNAAILCYQDSIPAPSIVNKKVNTKGVNSGAR